MAVQYVDYTLWQQEWLGAESDPDSVIAGQLGTGGRSWPICPRWCRCRRIGPARRCPVTAVMGWSCASTRRCGRGSRRLAAAHNATASMVLQAVMAVVLHRVGVGEDVVMGTPIAGRLDAGAR